MKFIIFLFVVFYTFSNSIENLSELSFNLMNEIKKKERTLILESFSSLGIKEEKEVVSLILVEDKNKLGLFTVPSEQYKALLQNNEINNIDYLSHISIVFLENDEFYFQIKSGLLEYLLHDGLILEFSGEYEKIIDILAKIHEKLRN